MYRRRLIIYDLAVNLSLGVAGKTPNGDERPRAKHARPRAIAALACYAVPGSNGRGPAAAWKGRRDQQGFLFAREFAARSKSRRLVERRLQVAEHEALLGPVDGRAADPHADGDIIVIGPRVRC